MEQIMACRICLTTDVKLYDMSKYRLKTAYENLSGLNMMDHQQYPQHVCSFCGALLKKFLEFRQKCVHSQQLLDNLFNASHTPVTTNHIKSINRTQIYHRYATKLVDNINYFIPQAVIKQEINEFAIKPDVEYEDIPLTDNYDTNEKCHIKNIGEDVTYNYEAVHASGSLHDTLVTYDINFPNYNSTNDNLEPTQTQTDSDEEPLSKKTGSKTRKKSKKKLKMTIKAEDCSINNLDVLKCFKSTSDVKYEDTEFKMVILTKQEQIQELNSRRTSLNYQNSMYKCNQCYKGFIRITTYKNHMAKHDVVAGPEVCEICQTRWPDGRSLRGHLRTSHERKYICKLCGLTTKSNHKAKEHIKWHKGYVFTCKICGDTFEKSTTYLSHVRMNHPSPHTCDICGESFIGQYGLNMHKKRSHSFVNTDTNVQFLKCGNCDFQCKTVEALNRHMDLTIDGNCSDLRSCEQCGDNFTTKELLEDHLRMHQRINAIRTCDDCSRTFTNERSLAVHQQRVHRGVKLHRAANARSCVCEVCGSKIASRAALVRHLRTHTGEKPYQCTLCPKRFGVYQRLQIHQRTHTGERPFKCGQCPKAFKHKAALNRHDRVHTGAKPYKCLQCDKAFSQSNSLKQHCAGVHMKMYKYTRKSTNKLV